MKQKLAFLLIIVLIVLSACSLTDGSTGTGGVPTAVVTLVAPTAVSPTATATATAVPTVTVTATRPATATALPATAVPATQTTQTGTHCTDAATFIADVTIPDNSQVSANTGFIKTWRVRNSGTCTWDGRYQLTHAGGHLLGAITNHFPLAQIVAPGQTIDLSVSLVAPAAPDTYQGDWKLVNPGGAAFGVGRSNSPLWVKIVVPGAQVGQSSISGYAWQDKNQNNVADANELLAGVTITLATTPECQAVLGTTVTDGNGRFRFDGLFAGSYCLFGTDGSTTVGQSSLALSNNQQLTNVAVTWPPVWSAPTTVSGLIYEDTNQNGSYDAGEPGVGNAEVWLIPGTACQVAAAPYATTFSMANGVYTLAGEFNGSYCVGLKGPEGLEDVLTVTVSSGQAVNNINLHTAVRQATISGYLWNDFCYVSVGQDGIPTVDGSCVSDGYGGYRADGMIEPNETYISGVTLQLQAGPCSNGPMTAMNMAVTDSNGRYTFRHLSGGTFCVFMDAAANGNAAILLPGNWTFPAPGIWYQEITLSAGDQAFPVNFGWDYQLQ
ncbi:MAG: hypothetical protein H6659_09735 [Ardenticatenaceae bacterium]|nr:hypothetical protein [Ardenticatenaceae bacterium]